MAVATETYVGNFGVLAQRSEPGPLKACVCAGSNPAHPMGSLTTYTEEAQRLSNHVDGHLASVALRLEAECVREKPGNRRLLPLKWEDGGSTPSLGALGV